MNDLYCIETIFLDLCVNTYESLRVKQNDIRSRFVKIVCTENKVPIELINKDYNYKVVMMDADKNVYSQVVNAEPDGTIIADLTDVIKTKGKSKLELQISSIDNTKRISTMLLEIIVEKSVY